MGRGDEENCYWFVFKCMCMCMCVVHIVLYCSIVYCVGNREDEDERKQ